MQNTPYFIIVPGYLVAVASSAFAATFIFLVSQGVSGGFSQDLIHIAPFYFLIAGFFIFLTAMPGFAFIVYLAGKHNSHHSSLYTIGGGVNALIAHLLLWVVTGDDFRNMELLPLVSVFAGAFGGWAYYFFRRKTLRL